MKTNAPEKIYVHSEAIFKALHKRRKESDIEYTRTDAFIEKTCEWLKENKDKYLYNTGSKGEYIPTCSDKMIDDFKKIYER